MNDLFKFIGDENSFPPGLDKPTREEGWPKNGKIYMLELRGRGAFMGVLIEAPWRIPYDNWNKFFENWERA